MQVATNNTGAKAGNQLQPVTPARLPNGFELPWPGQPWPGIDGAIYAGLCPGDLSSEPYHLVLLQPRERMSWSEAIVWARGFGADLPTRNEGAFLYAFHRHLFDAKFWFWTGTEYWTGTVYSVEGAWGQGFDDGYQIVYEKTVQGRVCAVRRYREALAQAVESAELVEA